MKKAIVYASVHHGNTEKIVKSIAEECKVDLIDAVKHSDADLSSYDMIGFASGIYSAWMVNLDAKDTIHLVPLNWSEVLQKDIQIIKISKMQWDL